MERLRQRELRALVDFLIDGERVEDLDAFVRHVLRGLPKLVPCASIADNEINTRRGRIEWVADPDEATRFPGCEEILSRHIADHPVCRDLERTGRARWSRFADFMTRRELANQPIYQEFFRRINVHHQLAIMYPSQDSASLALALNRDTTEFSDRERLLLNLLRPHIRRRYAQAEALTELRAQLALLSRGDRGRGSRPGRARPRRARRERDRGRPGLAPPLPRLEGLEPPSAPAPGRVDARAASRRRRSRRDPAAPGPLRAGPGRPDAERAGLARGGGPRARPQGDRAPRGPGEAPRPGTTAREAEVLGWVAEGKTHWEIAAILGRSPRTVHHHLEHVYAKLGVETRTAAARRAREIGDGAP